tara:strand:- start:115 stop:981 length:867 start_codon:yes stop_codon:yes gene_type:complete
MAKIKKNQTGKWETIDEKEIEKFDDYLEQERVQEGFEKTKSNNKKIPPESTEYNLFPTRIKSYDLPTELFTYKSHWKLFDEHEMPTAMNDLNYTQQGAAAKNAYMFHDDEIEEIKEIKDYVLDCVYDYNKSMLGYEVEHWAFSQVWTSQKWPGHHHSPHIHPNSIISGIIHYSEVQDNLNLYNTEIIEQFPPTIFQERIELNQGDGVGSVTKVNQMWIPRDQEMIRRSKSFPISFKPNHLILFPSWLPHYVPKNITPLARKCISMNIIPKHSLGEEKHLTKLQWDKIK